MKNCATDRCVLITNGNLAVMVALAPWIKKYRNNIVKIYITCRLPSEKSNVKGLFRMLYQSGWDYTYLKLWVNKIAPLIVKLKGWPTSLADYISRANLDIPIEKVYSVNDPRVIEEEIKSITLEPGGTGILNYNVVRDVVGTYDVEMSGLTGSFTVIESETTESTLLPSKITTSGWITEDDIEAVISALKVVLPQAGFRSVS